MMPVFITSRSTSNCVGLALLLIAVVIGGCGGSHHSSSPSDLTISDLQVLQNTSTHVLGLQATFVDLDGDLFNGTCNVSTNIGAVAIPINKLGPGFAPTATSGPISCVIQFKSGLTGTPLTGTMSVTDAAGHVSNALSFTTTIPEQRLGATPANTVASISAGTARVGR